MTNPVGAGWIVCLLVLVGLVAILILLFVNYKNLSFFKKRSFLFVLFFAIFAFLGVNSVTFSLPIGLYAFRFWMLLAIPTALFSAYGLGFLLDICKKYKQPKLIPWLVILLLVGISLTSAYPKYLINTGYWADGELWESLNENLAFTELRNQSNLMIFPACKDGFKKLIGNDQFACAWCKDELDFQKEFFNKSPLEISFFLRQQGYQSVNMDSTCLRLYSEEGLMAKGRELVNSGLFTLDEVSPNLFVFAVKT